LWRPLVLGTLQKFGPILWGEGYDLLHELGLVGGAEFWSRRSTSGDLYAYFKEEVLLAGGGTDAEQANRTSGGVVKLVGSVGWDVDGFAGTDSRRVSAEGGFHLAFEQDEGLFEVVAMGRGSASGWDVHVDEAEAAVGLVAGEGDGAGIADEADVGKVAVG
jgi:hypothetical protein